MDTDSPTEVEPDRPGAKPRGGLLPGVRLGRYIVTGRLGAGGMGVVYSAYDRQLDRSVALKVLRVPGADAQSQSELEPGVESGSAGMTRFIREAQAMAHLAHPNVLRVFDVGQEGELVFLAMALVEEGKTLKHWLGSSPRPWREVLPKFIAAGKGLAAAHDAGIIHRDFKPENVLINGEGRVMVADFGLARVRGRPDDERSVQDERPAAEAGETGGVSSDLTEAGVVLGTPRYMGPEAQAGGDVDPRSDQWSYCVALWEALYGGPPFRGSSRDELVSNIMRGQRHPAPPEISVPRWLRAVLDRGLQRDPNDRYPSMPALLDTLHRAPRRIRRWQLGTLAVVLGTAAAATTFAIARPSSEVCVPPALASGSGPDLATREILGAYGERWAAAWRSSCEATRVHRLQSAGALRDQHACLEVRRAEFVALAEEVRELDDVAAWQRATVLRDPEACRTRSLASDDAAEGRSDAASRASADEALTAATTALAAGALDDARSHYDVAVLHADRGRSDVLGAEAWVGLVAVAARRADNSDVALELVETARAAVARADAGPRLSARLEGLLAGIQAERGAWDLAIAARRRALTLRSGGDAHRSEAAAAMGSLSRTELAAGRAPEALAHAVGALARAQSAYPEGHPALEAYRATLAKARAAASGS